MSLPEEMVTPPSPANTAELPIIDPQQPADTRKEEPAKTLEPETKGSIGLAQEVGTIVKNENIAKGNQITAGRDAFFQMLNPSADADQKFLGEFGSIEKYIHDLPEPNPRIRPTPGIISDAVTKLRENNLILLDGFHGPALETVAAHVSIDAGFLHLSKKMLCVDDFSGKLDKSSLHDFLFGLATKLNNTIIVVCVETSTFSGLVVKELTALKDSSRAHGYKQALKDQNLYCVFLTSNTKFITEYSGKLGGDSSLRCNVPWMPYLLHWHFMPEECESLHADIELLRRFDFWNYVDDLSFFKEIEYAVITNTLKTFIEGGKAWEHKSPEERLRLKKERTAVTSPARMLEKRDDLILSLVFLVSYFPDLTVSEFLLLFETLIEGESTKEEMTVSEEQVTAMVPVSANNNGKQQQPKSKNISLTERWKSAPDSYLQKAGIRAFYSENRGIEIIDFEDGNFRSKSKAYLEAHYPILVQKLCDKLFLDKRQLFVWDQGSRIFTNLINLACHFANKNPDHYCVRLLIISTIDISDSRLVFEGDMNDSNQLWQFIEANFEYEQFKKNSLGRVSKLIIGMLAYPKLCPKVNDFFTELIDRNQYQAVLLLLCQLPPATAIDVVSWIRFIINNGPVIVKLKAIECLVEWVVKLPENEVFSTLQAIWSWVTNNPKISSYDRSYGLVFITSYLFSAFKQLQFEQYGKWPCDFHPFRNVAEAAEWKQRLDLIFRWISHKDLQKMCLQTATAFTENEMTPDQAIEAASLSQSDWLGVIIERLYLVINGFQSNESGLAERTMVANIIREKVREFFDMATTKKMKLFWAGLQSYLLAVMFDNKDDSEYYQFLKSRREHLNIILKYSA